jgi:hypothetical protein
LAYPVLRPTREIFDIWGADEIQGTTHTPEGDIARFNWSDPQERAAAETYKACELPFKVCKGVSALDLFVCMSLLGAFLTLPAAFFFLAQFYGVPELDEVTALWTDDYLSEKMPTSIYTVLRSESSRFMWYDKRLRKDEMMAQDPTVPEDWLTPPTDIDPKMAYPEWSRLAREADALGLGPDSPHWYLEAQAPKKGSEGNFIYEDLGLFRAVPDSFWVPEPEQNRGIQCRLGMRGITAASHFDSGRNFVAIISGSKRYVLHPPSQCPNLGIIPFPKHPSFRHSSLDWADEDELQGSLGSALGAQTILSTGEILYIPSFW